MDKSNTWIQKDFGLDRRLVKALSKIGFTYPTLIQARAIPVALQGKDLLVRSHTGSGKTVAFALPLLHKLLSLNQKDLPVGSVKAVILVPTNDLCKQIETSIIELMYYCRDVLSICSLSDDNNTVQLSKLKNMPDIIVSTPKKLATHLSNGKVNLSHVQVLVIDEADLVLSFGYSENVQTITSKLPKIVQGMLMSATLSPELEKFNKIILHNPVIIKLSDDKDSNGKMITNSENPGDNIVNLQQFYLHSCEMDKYLILYVFIKLGLLQGKGIIFVNDVNKCYRIKLFLQQFYISAAVLNAELPLNCRLHIVEEYNRGVFDYLLATDASVDYGEVNEKEESDEEDLIEEEEDEIEASDMEEDDLDEEGSEEDDDDENEGSEEDEEDEDDEEEDDDDEEEEEEEVEEEEEEVVSSKKAKGKPSKQKNASKSSVEFGVSRGIDFQNVAFVINFDFPLSTASYTHRIGRTARCGAAGTALSFVSVPATATDGTQSSKVKHLMREQQIADRDASILTTIQDQQPRTRDPNAQQNQHTAMIQQPSPLMFNTKELESFRYRVYDVLRSVTSAAVRELRTAEIKRELLNSQKLKSFFAENPNDLKVLRHDKAVLHPIRQLEHLKAIPEYLIPVSMRSIVTPHVGSKGKNKRQRSTESTIKSVDQKVKNSKMKDPLYGGMDDEDDAPAKESKNETYGDMPAGFDTKFSTAGRNTWKLRHNKGKFNAKNAKAQSSFKAGPGGSLGHKKK